MKDDRAGNTETIVDSTVPRETGDEEAVPGRIPTGESALAGRRDGKGFRTR